MKDQCSNIQQKRSHGSYIDAIILLDKKERMLSEIVVWLKAKGLWEQCLKDLAIRVKEETLSECRI